MKKLLRRVHLEEMPSAVFIFIACFIYFSLVSTNFLSAYNLSNILIQSVILAVIGLGVSIVIISGGLDLSVGSVLSLSGCVAGLALQGGLPLGVALILGMIAGIICGFLNGFMITKMNISPFIATLSMMYIAGGLANTISKRKTIYWEKIPFLHIVGNDEFLGIPIFFIIACAIAILVIFLFKKTKLGVYASAIGGNEEVPVFAGVTTVKWKIFIYSLSGLLAGMAGVLMIARMGCADPIVGTGFEFNAVVAAIIGGNNIRTGKGNLIGGVLGVVTLSMIKNGLSILRLQTHWQMIVIGLVLLIGILINKLLTYLSYVKSSKIKGL